MKKPPKRIAPVLWYLPFGLMIAVWAFSLWQRNKTSEVIAYSEFQEYLKKGQVAEVTISGNMIEGKFKTALPSGVTSFTTHQVDPDTARQLTEKNVKFSAVQENTWFRDILSWLLPIALLIGFWVFVMRRAGGAGGMGGMGGGLMSVGKSKAKTYAETDTKVTFADVAGVDEAKEELAEVVSFLRDPSHYGRLGARVPKGVLLVGPPGTGKTLLARAVAGEAAVPFFSISGSEFVEMFVGVGAARVRDLFEHARARAPAIIFIDELDALGSARSAYPYGGGHEEKAQTLNQLLAEMDGFDTSVGLMLLAATNRPEVLDPALLRSGRFDRQVLVDRPDKKGRTEILHVHIRKVRLSQDVEVEKIAALTPGFSGADLENLVNEAAVLATRRGATSVTLDDFTRGVERIVAGLEKKNRVMNEHERTVIAHHEMGHTLASMALPGSDPVHKVSIIPRGIGALGYTIQRPTEDRFLMTREELENKMVVLLAGRAAELLIFHQFSTGASDDLARATEIARNMVMRYGMQESLGPVSYGREHSPMLGTPGPPSTEFSEETSREIDVAVRDLLRTAFDRSTLILGRNRALLETSAQELLHRETLVEADLLPLRENVQKA